MTASSVRSSRAAASCLAVLALHGCVSPLTEPEAAHGPVAVTLTVELGSPPPTLAQLAVPAAVQSLVLEVRHPGCEGDLAFTTSQNTMPGQEDVVFSFEVAAGPTACFVVRAYSEPDGGGTLLFEGSTSGVDMTVEGALEVQVDLDLVGTTPPEAVTLPATDIGSITATLQGKVNPLGFPALGYFEYGATAMYGGATPPTFVGGGVDFVAISQAINGLSPGGTVHYRTVAVSGGHLVFGPDESFTTLPRDADVSIDFPEIDFPTVTTDQATDITRTAARLNATIDPAGSATSMHFEWGLDDDYGNTTPVQQLGAHMVELPFAEISGLAEGTEYHYRAVAYNAGGLTLGADRTFVARRTEADVIIALDTSASMDATVMDFVAAINGLAAASEGVALRVVLIADESVCVPAPLGSGMCPGDGNPPGYAHVVQPIGSSTALSRILSTHMSWGGLIRPESTRMFVVISNDRPASDGDDFDTSLRSLDPSLAGYRFSAYTADDPGGPLVPCTPPAMSPYATLVAATGGVLGNLCSGDMAPFFQELAAALVS